MVALANLQPASFRGARFLCPKDSASEGRNTIEHKYPDAGGNAARYAEDNGYCPPEFTITAVLHGPNLLSDFQALRGALNRKGPGTLHHPYYGAQLCAVKGPWKVQREDADSGVLTLDITFLVTSSAIFPALATAIPAVVSGLASGFITTALQSFAAAFGSPVLSAVSIGVLAAGVRAVSNAFQDVSGAPDVALAMGHFAESADRYVTDGTELASRMETLWRGAFEDLTYSSTEITRTLRKVDAEVAAIQVAAEAIRPTTLDYAARQQAMLSYSTFARLVTLASLAESTASATYTTADAVHDAQSVLLDTYAGIRLQDVSNDVGESIKDVMGAALAVLRDLELQLPRVAVQKLMAPIPASILAYMLYGSDSRTETVADLNLDQCPILLEYQANVLTGVE